MYTSTGNSLSTPSTTAYWPGKDERPAGNGAVAHRDHPFRLGHLVVERLDRRAIFLFTVPATIIKSAWRGEGRNTSAPNRARSKREAPAAIISMAQQASPKRQRPKRVGAAKRQQLVQLRELHVRRTVLQDLGVVFLRFHSKTPFFQA